MERGYADCCVHIVRTRHDEHATSGLEIGRVDVSGDVTLRAGGREGGRDTCMRRTVR